MIEKAENFLNQFESLNIPVPGVRLPAFKIEEKYQKRLTLKPGASNFDFLRGLCLEGFNRLGLKKDSEEYKKYVERTKYELSLIEELGFTDYFLLVWDVINFCAEKDIAVGYGRGSCVGSLVLFLIDVTKVDPIKYGLFFERFISRARAKSTLINGVLYFSGDLLPDIDNDVAFYRRGEVTDYLAEKFKGKTCKILTFNTLSSKLLIKEIGKIVGSKSEEEMTEVTSKIPKNHGIVEDIEEACKNVEEFRVWCDKNPLVYQTALKLRDLIKNSSVHPSGILLSHSELEKICPTQLTSDNELVSSYDMNQVSTFAIKLDILGLRGVSVVDDVCKSLGIKMTDINVNDERIYQALQDLKHPHGLFQLEASTAFQTTQKVKPKHLGDLTAILAIARPGALQFSDKYATFSNVGITESVHPFFDKILANSGGNCLYQEELMQMAHAIGFTLDEAEILRRIVGKKKLEEVKAWKQKIKDKVSENKLDPAIGDILWKILEDSASYSFNKCIFEEEFVEKESGKLEQLKNIKIGDRIRAYDVLYDTTEQFVTVLDVISGQRELVEIQLDDGKKIRASLEHKFLCDLGRNFLDFAMVPLKQVLEQELRIVVESDCLGARLKSIVKSKKIGVKNTIDLEVDSDDHNFFCNGICVSNSHAAAYATLSAATVYLKFLYPTQFYLSLLKMTRHEPEPIQEIAKIHREMNSFGIKLLPPSLTRSNIDFAIEGKDIRFGLSSIKGVSEKTIEKIKNFKRTHENKFQLFEAAKEAGINIGTVSSIIQAGMLEGFGKTRTLLVYEAQLWNQLSDKEKRIANDLGPKYNFELAKIVKAMAAELKDEKSRPLIKESRMGTIIKKTDKYKKIYKQNSICESFANWWYEKELLGYVTYTTLLEIFRHKKASLRKITEVMSSPDGSAVDFVGVVDEDPTLGTTKTESKSKYARFSVSDEYGTAKILIFNKSLEQCKDLNGTIPKEGDVVIVCGVRKGDDCVFANTIASQKNEIYTRLSELSKEDTVD